MPRPPAVPSTALGAAVQVRRGDRTAADVAHDLRVSESTLLRIERGANRPTYDTAVRLAAWLNWTVEQVMTAAATAAP